MLGFEKDSIMSDDETLSESLSSKSLRALLQEADPLDLGGDEDEEEAPAEEEAEPAAEAEEEEEEEVEEPGDESEPKSSEPASIGCLLSSITLPSGLLSS